MKHFSLFLFMFLLGGITAANAQNKPAPADFFSVEKIQDIKISFKQTNWSYILDSLRFNGDGLLAGVVEINGIRFENAGVRFRGFKSFAPNNPRNPLHIVLDSKEKLANYQGTSVVKLSNTLRDPSMLREVLGYEIARNYMPAPRANFTKVTINGKYYGLFANIESVSEANFLSRFFESADNAFFKANQDAGEKQPSGCKNNLFGSLEYDNQISCYENNFEKLSEHGTKDLMELAKILNQETDKIETVLNIDNTLWMLAFNNVVVNLSSYTGQNSVNYYLYQDDDGRFSPIIWDLNLAFGSFKNIGSGSDLKLKGLQELDPLLHLENTTKPLISKLLSDPDYKKIYLTHMKTILQDWFTSGKFDKRAKELQAMIRSAVNEDPNKSYTIAEFDASLEKTVGKKSKIPGLLELMTRRTSFLKAHPELAVFPPEISQVQVEGRKPLSSQKVQQFHITAKVDKFPKRVELYYRLDGKGSYTMVSMQDDSKFDDGTANNNIYGVIIVPQNGEQSIEYYIVAENPGLISYSPANYMWEKHKSTLEALNK